MISEWLLAALAEPGEIPEGATRVQRTVRLTVAELLTVIAKLDAALRPATPSHAAWCIRMMAEALRYRRNGEAWSFKVAGWLLALGHLPDDLWTSGTKALLVAQVTTDEFPAPADLLAAVDAKWQERRRLIRRANELLASMSKQRRGRRGEFLRDTPEVRLRTMIAGWRAIGRDEMARPHEVKLAAMEGRAPEEWANLDGVTG